MSEERPVVGLVVPLTDVATEAAKWNPLDAIVAEIQKIDPAAPGRLQAIKEASSDFCASDKETLLKVAAMFLATNEKFAEKSNVNHLGAMYAFEQIMQLLAKLE